MSRSQLPRARQGQRRTESFVSLEQLHRQLTEAIATIETGDQWQAWLDFSRQLHQYSFNNLILIWSQRPDATSVASYRTWQALNRQVRRGETALRVLAPITRRTPVLDESGRAVLGPDGRPRQQQRITAFRPAPVFDISQTDGPPPPEAPRPALLTGQAPAGLWQALVGEISERGYRLMRGPASVLDGANGLTKLAEREVWVRDDVDDAQAVKTLTHELAHVILHTRPEQPRACTGMQEIEAESVAHLVMAAHGVETATYTFPYVSSWAQPLAAAERVPMTDIVARTGGRVTEAASAIINVTRTTTANSSDPAKAALAARVTEATKQAGELREHASASLLPSVERATLLGVIADSQDYFQRQVPQSWVREYLTGRGLDAAITSHSFGYAPRSWTALTDHLRHLGYTDDHIEAAGMATKARTGHLIDRFRDRLTIPLHDRDGDLVAFTGRAAPYAAGDFPKYLNCPTTSIFRKSENMYGHAALAAVNSDAVIVICEGPLDAVAVDLMAAEKGWSMTGFATIGTAFTEHHARQLLAVVGTPRLCLAFDGDNAGHEAAEAAWRRLTDHGPRDIRLAELPEGEDPASLSRSEMLAQTVGDARPAATVVAERKLEAAGPEHHAVWELTAFRSLSRYTTRMPVEQRAQFLLDLAQRLNIDPGEAATVAVEQNPAIMMEKIASRADDLAVAVRLTPTGDQHIPLDSPKPAPRTISR